MTENVKRWEAMVAAQPTNDLARFSLGKALYDAGRIGEALPHFEQALGRKPDWMVVQILVGKCHLSLGDRTAARGAFERAHRLAIEQQHEGPQMEMEQLLAELR